MAVKSAKLDPSAIPEIVELASSVLSMEPAGRLTVEVAVIVPTTKLPILDVDVTSPPFSNSSVDVELANCPPQVVGVHANEAPEFASVPQVMLPEVSALRSQFELLRPETVRPPPPILIPPANVEVAVEVARIEATVGVEVATTCPEPLVERSE